MDNKQPRAHTTPQPKPVSGNADGLSFTVTHTPAPDAEADRRHKAMRDLAIRVLRCAGVYQ